LTETTCHCLTSSTKVWNNAGDTGHPCSTLDLYAFLYFQPTFPCQFLILSLSWVSLRRGGKTEHPVTPAITPAEPSFLVWRLICGEGKNESNPQGVDVARQPWKRQHVYDWWPERIYSTSSEAARWKPNQQTILA
jgi:hypothetical protein